MALGPAFPIALAGLLGLAGTLLLLRAGRTRPVGVDVAVQQSGA